MLKLIWFSSGIFTLRQKRDRDFKGFEEHFDGTELGEKLWDVIWEAGQKFNISPGCPNLIDRIEAGLLSYGNDFTKDNNPLECNLDRYCNENDNHEFVGKEALKKTIKKKTLF